MSSHTTYARTTTRICRYGFYAQARVSHARPGMYTYRIEIIPPSAGTGKTLASVKPGMSVCIYVYVFVHINVCVCVYACMRVLFMYICICVCVCVCVYVYVCMHLCMCSPQQARERRWRPSIRVCVCICMYVCVCIYVCLCVCMHICMYVCVQFKNSLKEACVRAHVYAYMCLLLCEFMQVSSLVGSLCTMSRALIQILILKSRTSQLRDMSCTMAGHCRYITKVSKLMI